jgi:hypothetical protein
MNSRRGTGLYAPPDQAPTAPIQSPEGGTLDLTLIAHWPIYDQDPMARIGSTRLNHIRLFRSNDPHPSPTFGRRHGSDAQPSSDHAGEHAAP